MKIESKTFIPAGDCKVNRLSEATEAMNEWMTSIISSGSRVSVINVETLIGGADVRFAHRQPYLGDELICYGLRVWFSKP